MVLSPETVNAYKELLTNPQKHGLQFKPLHECFERQDRSEYRLIPCQSAIWIAFLYHNG